MDKCETKSEVKRSYHASILVYPYVVEKDPLSIAPTACPKRVLHTQPYFSDGFVGRYSNIK